jgi:hypothetical protein
MFDSAKALPNKMVTRTISVLIMSLRFRVMRTPPENRLSIECDISRQQLPRCTRLVIVVFC